METVVEKAFTISDSIFLVLLIGLALGTWWIIRWILTNQKEVMVQNNEREKRYIGVIETQAKGLHRVEEIGLRVDGIGADVKEIKQYVFRRGD